ncbi:MAG: hypothetical protein WCO00_16310 [Rhodospirillaceae bacterium]
MAMLRNALFSIIRQEERQLEDQIEAEQKRPAPDLARLSALRQEAKSLRRELEIYADR